MNRRDLNFILSVLQKKEPESAVKDWYAVYGFLELNKIGGYFYGAAKQTGILLPQSVERKLWQTRAAQAERNRIMRGYVQDIGETLRFEKVNYAFLKGSVLSNTDFRFSEQSFTCMALADERKAAYRKQSEQTFYGAGERASNDIDLLIEPKDIARVTRVLKEMGFVQGYYDFRAKKAVELPRAEIVSRRMNRGETAPFVSETVCESVPFIEIDLNFSLSYLPQADNRALSKMLEGTIDYAGLVKGGVRSLALDEFFLHLIAHQYKESILYSMVERGKDVELYKLLDLYLFLAEGYIDLEQVYRGAKKYGLEGETRAVLRTVGEVFDGLSLEGLLQSLAPEEDSADVIDPPRKKEYRWTAPVRERLCAFDRTRYLAEKTNG